MPKTKRVRCCCVKAYKVSCRDDDHGAIIVFSNRVRDVSRRCNSGNCDCEWIEISVVRAPAFDKYAPGPITVRQYLAEGWYRLCQNCETLLFEDQNPIITDNESAFCNRDCLRKLLDNYKRDGYSAHESILSAVASMERWIEADIEVPELPAERTVEGTVTT